MADATAGSDLTHYFMANLRFLNFSRVPANFLSLRAALFLLLLEIILGVIGYIALEDYNFPDAFYMVVITISTVGFSEIEPLSEAGRIFTSGLIFVNIGVFAYLLATFSYYIIEGEIFKRMHLNQIEERISKMEGHVILCGFGKYGKEISSSLALHGTPYVIIENDPEKIEIIQQTDSDILYLEGDSTLDEILQKAGIEKARGLIAALGEDSDNLFLVLSARALNPNLTIVSRAILERSQAKLIKAGANHVVMPENIGGFYMAMLMNKPGAVEFFSFITSEYHSDMGFEELHYRDLPEMYQGRPISDLALRSQTGANIIGYRNQQGDYQVNPAPSVVLKPGEAFIVLGNEEQLKKLRILCKTHTS
ncbi:potassium channel family protein [Lewinella cohaerens]|uniref:potassium channel family protein n=1 Tax=Lewinella cohaerens TaxID=70995 RepID=UPI00035F15A0|nr:potassium channel protein [Lewinella cohaerens]